MAGGEATLHMERCTHGGHTTPAYIHQFTSLGGPPAHGGCTGWSARRCGSGCATVKRHRAQSRRNPWVRALSLP